MRKCGGVEQRCLRLEGAIAAAASQDSPILGLTCGTHYLNLLERGSISQSGAEWLQVLGRNISSMKSSLERKAQPLSFGASVGQQDT